MRKDDLDDDDALVCHTCMKQFATYLHDMLVSLLECHVFVRTIVGPLENGTLGISVEVALEDGRMFSTKLVPEIMFGGGSNWWPQANGYLLRVAEEFAMSLSG